MVEGVQDREVKQPPLEACVIVDAAARGGDGLLTVERHVRTPHMSPSGGYNQASLIKHVMACLADAAARPDDDAGEAPRC